MSSEPSISQLQQLQARLGHRFADLALLQQALTHRSFGVPHNERLEFLGDAVLNLAVAHELFGGLGESAEGDLTRLRAHLVREASLHQVALELGVPEMLKISEGEAKSGGAQRPSMLADAVEALLGAVFLEAGYPAARACVQRLMGRAVQQAVDSPQAQQWAKDAKTQVQEWLQAKRMQLPVYRIVQAQGEKHAQVFDVECAVPALNLVSRGQGRSRRAAEQEAAAALLPSLKIQA